MSPPVPRSAASVAATKVSRSNRSSAKVMAAKFPGMVGVRDEKRPFDRLGANEVVPGVSLFEQLRPFLLQHRAELIAEHREESGEIEFGMDIGVLHVETAGDALPHRLAGRSEERRVGKEGGSKCRSRGAPY